MKIGFVTCSTDKMPYFYPTRTEPDFIPTELPFTPDDQIAVNELRKRGHEVHAVVWNTPVNTLSDFSLIVVRSPWDYMDSEESKTQFMEWLLELEAAGLRVSNPATFINWTLDKHYLEAIEKEGIKVIPTEYHEKGSTIDLLEEFEKRGDFVLKPCISAGGKGLFHIGSLNGAQNFQKDVDSNMQIASYMLQDYIPEIITHGEWSLVFLGGKYSHALHKKPGPGSIMVHAERGGTLSFSQTPKRNMLDFADTVYQKMFSAFNTATHTQLNPKFLLYLRLDIIETKNGLLLIECEGAEPELFFRARPGSEYDFCKAIEAIF